jgi:peptidoglycan/LPS O-acetylase OafA/YrhL
LTAESTPIRPRRLAPIDGLRGIAALSVVAYHAWLYTLPRVSAGVRRDWTEYAMHELRLGLVLFFVLSGFLLFGPWARAGVQGGRAPSLRRYAERRVRRIVPAYYVAVAGSIALLWSLDRVPGVRLPDASNLWLFALFAQNFSENTLLTLDPPMWTLSVEATFYAALPLLGALALAAGSSRLLAGASRRRMALVPLAMIAAGVWWNWWIAGSQDLPTWVSKVLPAMLPYFALGMLAALAAHGRRLGSRATTSLVLGGAALVLLDAIWQAEGARSGSHELTLRVYRDLPAAVGFAVVMGAATSGAGFVPRVLGWRPLAAIGTVSYGLYLWHVPVMLWLRANDLLPLSALGGLLVALPISLALAAISWRFIEKPLLGKARPPSRPERAPSPVPAGSGLREAA